ncbi:hypothetical protein C2G38_2094771 [Gigaspora rosea]|uniref:Uncharacterized protein n=1 Tax=Gigaspora rosea TaxID=44941 RepID=A0A397UXD2_9GLOM|nr:hypothetical protein C2G38_2094771 [Gigaspora rosea]
MLCYSLVNWCLFNYVMVFGTNGSFTFLFSKHLKLLHVIHSNVCLSNFFSFKLVPFILLCYSFLYYSFGTYSSCVIHLVPIYFF